MIDFDTEELKTIERGMSIMRGVLPEADEDWEIAGRVQRMIENRPPEPDSYPLPIVVVDIIDKVSELSTVLGAVTSIRGDGRMMAWAGREDYWFWLVIEQGEGKNDFHVLIDESQAPDDLLYNAVGYCVYHNIKHKFVFDTDKHQMAGFLALDRMGHNGT
jgi:hypothetical protein